MNKHEGEPRPPPEGSSLTFTIRPTSPTSLEISVVSGPPGQDHPGKLLNEPGPAVASMVKTLERLIALIPEDHRTINAFLTELEESLGKNEEGGNTLKDRTDGILDDVRDFMEELKDLERELGIETNEKQSPSGRLENISAGVEELEAKAKNPDVKAVTAAVLDFLGQNIDSLPPNDRQRLIVLLKERFGNDIISDNL